MAPERLTSADPRTVYHPRNPVATYVDDYGDERIVHAPRGKNSALRRFKDGSTVVMRLNRAIAILMGQEIRRRREAMGISGKELLLRAGLTATDGKAYIYQIEKAERRQGVRLGTLYALAHALNCTAADLLPTETDAMQMAGITAVASTTLGVAA